MEKLLRHHVFYHDGYEDSGDVGKESFESEDEALSFIDQRLSCLDKRDLPRTSEDFERNYTYVVGDIKQLAGVEVVTKVKVKS